MNKSEKSELPSIPHSERDKIAKFYENLHKFVSIQPIILDEHANFITSYRNQDSVLPEAVSTAKKKRKNQLLFQTRLTTIECRQPTSRSASSRSPIPRATPQRLCTEKLSELKLLEQTMIDEISPEERECDCCFSCIKYEKINGIVATVYYCCKYHGSDPRTDLCMGCVLRKIIEQKNYSQC